MAVVAAPFGVLRSWPSLRIRVMMNIPPWRNMPARARIAPCRSALVRHGPSVRQIDSQPHGPLPVNTHIPAGHVLIRTVQHSGAAARRRTGLSVILKGAAAMPCLLVAASAGIRSASQTLIKLYSWNVNGIRSVLNKQRFQPFLQAHQPDIVCLQETKAQRGQIEIDLPNYHEYWNSAVKKGYSGTAIFSKQAPLKVINGFPQAFSARYRFADELQRDSAEEGRVITAEYPHFYVVTVYTPNAKDDLSRLALRFGHWDPAFLAYCRQLEQAKPVVFCGDLNVAHTELDLANPKSNRGKKGFT